MLLEREDRCTIAWVFENVAVRDLKALKDKDERERVFSSVSITLFGSPILCTSTILPESPKSVDIGYLQALTRPVPGFQGLWACMHTPPIGREGLGANRLL